MKKHLFLILAVVIMAIFLAGCQKEILVETPQDGGLYLKSAVNETTSVQYFKDGKIEDFSYPDNILFKISGSKAEILNKIFFEVKSFNLMDNQAMFLVAPVGSKPMVLGEVGGKTIYDMNMESVYADLLPFFTDNFGLQSAIGDQRFNGLLKAGNYVFAVKDGQVMIYSLSSSGKITTAQGSIQNDVLTFKVGTETWVLKFLSLSPIGNIFEFSGDGKNFTCYTLS